MERLKQRLARAWLLRFAVRLQVLLHNRSAARKRPRDALGYLFRSRELSNFTYELENMDDLARAVAEGLGAPVASVRECIDELDRDTELRDELRALLGANPKRDSDPRYGYRYMYYCVVRLTHPEVVVEVGTHDGLGAALLLRALERNAAAGHPGELHTLDQTAEAGWLIPQRLRERCTHHTGDATETLEPLLRERGCGFLIDDIGFAFPGKPWLFEAALGQATRPLTIASEFPARTDGDPPTALFEAAEVHGGRYAEFVEQPRQHFWPGHAQGLASFASAAP
jgi:hypothetical protein